MIKATKRGEKIYEFNNGWSMQRELEGLTPNGNRYSGRWVLRDDCGFVIDFDLYRNDIAERNNLDLYCVYWEDQ